MSLKQGETYKNYHVTKVLPLKEIGCTLIECLHQPSGASIIKLLNEDEENLFALSFKTWPQRSDGVAHILEHTVLCGSSKYPVKDPFFGMTKRSLNTYMNALTGGDFTCYPAATQIKKDFYNLLSVYLDAAFHPQLNPLSFMQEGHHLEFEKKDDPNSALTCKGIVFNEMKGALGNKEARLSEEIMHSLYPDITYGINSGGDPKEIMNLTYEQLKEFHETYYHPSRCYFFFYGNLAFEEQLDYLEEHAFKGITYKEQLPLLPNQKRFTQKKTLVKYYPALASKEKEESNIVAISYLTCSILEQEELLALNVLDILLMGTDGSPLRMALLKSNLCQQVDEVIDNEMNDVPYIIICKGCKEGGAEKIEAVIDTTLRELMKEGFSQEMIEGAIHQLEMSRLEITGGSSPYGLSLFFRSILLKQHGGNVEDALLIHSLFTQLRQREPSSYCKLIKKHFLDNMHKTVIEMRPDTSLAKKEEEAENKKLSAIKESLSKKEQEEIINKSTLLEIFQNEREEGSLDCLPKIHLQDVPKTGTEFALDKSTHGPITLFAHRCFTNHLLYTDLILDLPRCEPEDMPYVRLFCYLLPQLGTAKRNYKENLDFMLQHTGGITSFFDLGQHIADPQHMQPFFCLRGKSLYRKTEKLFTLLKETLETPDFSDKERIQELLTQQLSGLESSIQRSPLRFAINLAASTFSSPSAIINQCYGLPFYWKLKEIVAEYKKNPRPLLEKLETLKERILRFSKAEFIVGANDEMVAKIEQEGIFGLPALAQKRNIPAWVNSDFKTTNLSSQAREITAGVSFTTSLFPTISYSHPEAAALSIATEIMENLVLHPTIREQGGAYGCGAVFTAVLGQFHFYTYRDPHLASSINAFKKSITQICEGKFTEDDIEQAKLQLFQDDSPIPPYARAYTAYTRIRSGRTPEVRQQHRERLFAANKKDVQLAVHTWIKEQMKKAIVVTFAGKELLERESALLESPLPCYSIEETHV